MTPCRPSPIPCARPPRSAPRWCFPRTVFPTPRGMSSTEFAAEVLEKAAVLVAAGAAYGEHGEGYFRISMTVPDDRLEEAMDRLKKAYS